ncbi:inositol monophosphatase 1-like [Adelges cooleyi]|uniref:inositol monophosphatase 1-like n=1 Tax=Adelges cooleyi TaxID=133065 RepID=UPI00217F604F|nr:inositol monophosphatase 1-like [Adelges cooleyi]
MADVNQYYKDALNIVLEAGKILKLGFNSPKEITTKTNIQDFVTQYDKLVEKTIIEAILKLYPNHKFIAEESAAQNTLTTEPTWILDPIDGTTNFIQGFPFCCISLALAIDKDLKIGIVYNPVLDQLFTGQKGKGAFLNSKQIHVNDTEVIFSAMIGFDLICFANNEPALQILLKKCELFIRNCRGIRSLGSAALQLCYLAMGAVDICVFKHLKCWDVAAGNLIIQEAGGIILDLEGRPYNNIMDADIIATCTRKLADELLKITK